MKHKSKLTPEQQQETIHPSSSIQHQEFDSPEALLRLDASRTAVPETVLQRLSESLAPEPAPSTKPWWRRIFSA